MSMTPIEVIDITTDTDPNDPTLYLAAASRALDMYRKATSRHGMNDLMLFQMIGNVTVDGEYGSQVSQRTVMRKVIKDDKWIDPDPAGHEWEWWQDTAHDLLAGLGYERTYD